MTKEWAVITECGRNFIHSAPDLDFLLHDLVRSGYRAKHIEEYVAPPVEHEVEFSGYEANNPSLINEEYLREVLAKERQLEWNYEHKQVIEKREAI